PPLLLHSVPTRRSSDLCSLAWAQSARSRTALDFLQGLAGMGPDGRAPVLVRRLLQRRGGPLRVRAEAQEPQGGLGADPRVAVLQDRKSTRLNSSHRTIS